ncbi:Polyketide cyclase / dehydrase and lipid transport [Chryseobacterium taichungense]|uniref:Polyketide cyclase / dehydrase and lipid transport n=1 Tax=Chryseobacterium taichungense TaxID=295069 RepID=A0A1H7VVL9_9FLAO|nr:SRPBCC family protein [Chryseobacterium taichungense]SEM12919.1 Polyketide cyclase / dehydrase and lipid transport [Chryseobacterium taichungense]
MKTILKILGVIILLLVVYAVIAMIAFGGNYHYEKSMVIKAPKEKVWQQISSMKAFNQWNPWMKLDPSMKIIYSGNSGEIGDKYCWDSKNDDAGAGCQEIKDLATNQKQKTEMIFKRPFDGQATSEIKLSPEGNATKVTWTMDMEQDAMMKIMRPMMDYQMGKSYEEGLTNLKNLVEK